MRQDIDDWDNDFKDTDFEKFFVREVKTSDEDNNEDAIEEKLTHIKKLIQKLFSTFPILNSSITPVFIKLTLEGAAIDLVNLIEDKCEVELDSSYAKPRRIITFNVNDVDHILNLLNEYPKLKEEIPEISPR